MQTTENMARALTTRADPPALIWVNEGGDHLNMLSLLGHEVPDFMDLVIQYWNIAEHEDLFPTGFTPRPQQLNKAPIVVVERIPPAAALSGQAAAPLLGRLRKAKAVILLGTDASFGGTVTSRSDLGRFERTCLELKTPIIKLPGIPVPPHHLVGVLAHLEFFGFPNLDIHRRPEIYYGQTVCRNCERRVDLERSHFASQFGQTGCLLSMGCKGPVTHNTCSRDRWNHGENWCVGAGGPCVGCSEPGYPDHGGLGLYGAMTGRWGAMTQGFWSRVEMAGFAVLGLAAAGLGVRALHRLVPPAPERRPRPPRTGEDA